MTQKLFTFEATAQKSPGHIAVWTDGLLLDMEDDPKERKAGFHPAYRLIRGHRYRVTIEPLNEEDTVPTAEVLPTFTPEEQVIQETILAARKIQDFLWSGINDGIGFEEFRRMLRKRLVKMDELTFDNPYWRTEARKRLLQLAAVAIQCIGRLSNPGFLGTNLHEFARPTKELIKP